MSSIATDRSGVLNTSLAIKAPCRAATTADINASLTPAGSTLGGGGGGLFTLDGVALAANDRVLVKNQVDQTKNGIYLASTTAWNLDQDFNNRSLTKGTLVLVTDGTANGGLTFELTATNPTIGTSNITFAALSIPTISAAMSPVVGAATLAAARTALGDTATGDALFTTASAAAARTTLGLGNIAIETIGQGLEDDGAGNARVKLDTTVDGASFLLRGANGMRVDPSFLQGFIYGLNLSPGGSPNTQIAVAPGACADGGNTSLGKNTATKTLDISTTGANGLDTGTPTASKTYHIFAIWKADGTFATFSSRSDLAGLSPTLPFGFVFKRYLGSRNTDASAHFLAFAETGNGPDRRIVIAPVQEANSAAPASNLAQTLTLNHSSVPLGVAVDAILSGLVTDGTNASAIGYVSSLASPDVPANATNITAQNPTATTNGVFAGLVIGTNTNSQIRYRLSLTTTDITINVNGWIAHL